MSAARLRLFVALELPPAAVAALQRFAAAAADDAIWRRVPAASLHLTLAFLSATEAGAVPALAAATGEAARGPAPRLALAGALLLPPRRARVLTVALEDLDGTLERLQARISGGLAEAGLYTPENRPFRAHVTVARLRPGARPPRAAEATLDPAPFAADRLTLFRSRLHPGGARYSPLAGVMLAG